MSLFQEVLIKKGGGRGCAKKKDFYQKQDSMTGQNEGIHQNPGLTGLPTNKLIK